MVKIYVEQGTKIKDINKLIHSILTKDESVQGRFMALNNIPIIFTIGFHANLLIDKDNKNKVFQEYVGEYVVAPTNKRVLMFGIAAFNSSVVGIRQIDYEEITNFEYEDMKLKIELSKGSYYNLEAYYNYDNDKYALNAINAMDYIVNCLGEEKMKIFKLTIGRLAFWIMIIIIMATWVMVRLEIMEI